MTSEQVLAMTRLTETQRKVLDIACRGKTDRQISQVLGISVSHVTACMHQIRKKLGVKGEGHRALVHFYWTQGPGFSEIRSAAINDALREVVTKANQIISYHGKLVQEGKIQPNS